MSVAKILVVEDEASISNLVVSYLRKEGYQVYTATDGLSGLKAARALDLPPEQVYRKVMPMQAALLAQELEDEEE